MFNSICNTPENYPNLMPVATMHLHLQLSPDWYIRTTRDLLDIESNIADYDDEECLVPGPPVFAAVREFLSALKGIALERLIEKPAVFVSPNGHLVLCFGQQQANSAQYRKFILRFTTEGLRFHFEHWAIQDKPKKGINPEEAIEIIMEYFQVVS